MTYSPYSRAARPCRVQGCPVSAYGRDVYCGRHRQALRHNGHVHQRRIRKDDLNPYLETVERYRQLHPDKQFWAAVEARWKFLSADCDLSSGHAFGSPSNRHRWSNEAREVVRAVALRVPAWEVCKTALALYLMEKLDGRRFQDDTAFRYQLCQCLRRLSPTSYRTYFNTAGKIRASHLKEMHRQAIELLGDWLVLVFGLAGLMFANWVERVENRHRAATAAFKEAMTSLPDPDNETRVPNDN